MIPIIKEVIEENSIVITHELNSYNQLSETFSHGRVCHSAKQYVDGMFHTNGIENFWSHLKCGVEVFAIG